MRVAIAGGGIAGLAAARALVMEAERAGLPLTVEVFEAAPRWGGKIQTIRFAADPPHPSLAGAVIETGPDSVYVYKPRALELGKEMGLGDRIVPPDGSRRTQVLRSGLLVELPDGLLSLVPSRFGQFVTTPLIGWPGKLRMGLELLVPPRRDGLDESLGAFVRRRLGSEAVEYLAEPLLAGIHAADPWRLSVLATYPSLRQDETRFGSLVRATLARRWKARKASPPSSRRAPPPSPFASFRGGLSELVEALVEDLRPRAALHVATPVTAVSPQFVWAGDGVPGGNGRAGTGWYVQAEGVPGPSPGGPNRARAFDAVILALPSGVSARLAAPWDGELAGLLRQVEYASTAVAVLAFAPDAVPAASPVWTSSGVLVPPVEARRAGLVSRACSWLSTRWPHTTPGGAVVIRCFVGRFGDEAALQLSDAALMGAVRRDLRYLAGLEGEPVFQALFRWPSAMPQYQVGHLDRVAAIERRVARWPGLFLAGAFLRGMSVSDCVRQGEEAARACAAYLSGLAGRRLVHGLVKEAQGGSI